MKFPWQRFESLTPSVTPSAGTERHLTEDDDTPLRFSPDSTRLMSSLHGDGISESTCCLATCSAVLTCSKEREHQLNPLCHTASSGALAALRPPAAVLWLERLLATVLPRWPRQESRCWRVFSGSSCVTNLLTASSLENCKNMNSAEYHFTFYICLVSAYIK